MKNLLKTLVAFIALAGFAFAHAGDIDLSYVDKTGPTYTQFKHFVDANLPRMDGYLFLATDAAYMAKLDGGPQYCVKALSMDDAYAAHVNQTIAAGGQPNWGADADGSDGISSDSYLNVGTHVRDFVLVMKWCQPTAAQIGAYTAIITQAVYNVWHASTAQWGGHSFPWSGWSTTDPGDNYFYSFTLATMLYQWQTGDTQYANRTWPIAQTYFATLPTGGSEEGTGYGTSHKGLFEDIRFERDLFGQNYTDDHLRNSILYWAHAVTPDGLHFTGIGDQSRVSEPTWWDYQDVLVMQACAMTDDPVIKAQGAWLLARTPIISSTINYRDALLSKACGTTQTPITSLVYNASSTGDLFTVSDLTTHALKVDFRAGKYDQSHAHQDQGAFAMYKDGWVVEDESIFSHSGIEQGVINNSTLHFMHAGAVVGQTNNSTSTMTVTGTDPATGVHAVANLKPAAGAAVSAWTRNFDLVGSTLTITDAYVANAGYTGIWSANTAVKPIISGQQAVAGALTFTVVSPADAVLTATDWTTVNVPSYGFDYTKGWRLDVSSATNTGYKVVMTLGGVVPPPPVCPSQPAPLTQTATCPTGTHGSWLQTAVYAAVNPPMPPDHCWVLGLYLPSVAPSGACVADPPPPPPALFYRASIRQGTNAHLFMADVATAGIPVCQFVAKTTTTPQHLRCTQGPDVWTLPNIQPITVTLVLSKPTVN